MIAKTLKLKFFSSLIFLGFFLPQSGLAQPIPIPIPDTTRLLDSIRTARKQKIFNFTDSRYPIGWRIDTLKNIPTELRGENLSRGLTQTDPVEAAYEFLELNKEIFGIKNVREELKVESKFFDQYGGGIVFQQYYKGIPILWGQIGVRFTPTKKLKAIEAAFNPEIDMRMTVSTTPSNDSLAALAIVKQDLGLPNDYQDKIEQSKEQIGMKARPSSSASLEIHYLKEKYYLVWVVRQLVSETFSDWQYVIDAHTGRIIKKDNLVIWESKFPKTPSTNTPSAPIQKPIPPKPKSEEEFPFPPKVETLYVKTKPQPTPGLYQKMQDSLRKLEEKAWEEEAARNNMSPAELRRHLDELQI